MFLLYNKIPFQKCIKYLINLLLFIFLFVCKSNSITKFKNEKNFDEKINLKGTFTINSKYKENLYFSCENNKLITTKKKSLFDIIEAKENTFYIICKDQKKIVGIDKNKGNEVLLYSSFNEERKNMKIWKLINIKEQIFYIKSEYNGKCLMLDGKVIHLKKLEINSQSNKSKSNYEFRLLKLYQENVNINSYHLKIIEKEPIDLCIKYIDLRDNSLKRNEITQIYKDLDNEELKYSLRSIMEYIPWIRKIFIVMPNEKVRFLKSYDEIKDKIVYVKDKDLLGYDTANIYAFLFNLHKIKKFGISRNFIYMEDDYFVGKPLNKSDFFYYDEKKKKVFPYVVNTIFYEMNKKKILRKQKIMFKKKNMIKPHSHYGFDFSIMNTDKYFIEKYKIPTIIPKFTHCAIPLNVDDLKEIFTEIQDYEYINETLFSKVRHTLSINQQEFVNLYELNIKHRKVHKINYSYIKVEKIKINKLNIELFVVNTGGNHKPTENENAKVTRIMMERFPNPTIYERVSINNTFV